MIDRALCNLVCRLPLNQDQLFFHTTQQRIAKQFLPLHTAGCLRVLHVEQKNATAAVPRKCRGILQRRMCVRREVSGEKNVSERKHNAKPTIRKFLAQRRKGAKRYRVSKKFLCAFAPLRENIFFQCKHLQDIDFHAKLRKLSYSKLTDI